MNLADKIEGPTADVTGLELSDVGPQPIKKPEALTCTGCRHLKTKWWKDYLEDDETDSGTSAWCGALPDEYGGKSITAYWNDNRAPPSWCPHQALAQIERKPDAE